ncbi:WXG100 family type VII secretion target [Streptomyces sp. NPDC020917]|uniref:WXG100 family type VII secretion target n=1 Tax=Streptomyces sp. NPDC020917 TaxID=3365102 RepID=UPI00379C6666
MARPTDWHNLDLDGDPTPGDVYAIRTEGRRFQTFAEDVATVQGLLNNAAKDHTLEEWNGKAAAAFRERIGRLPGQLTKLHDSYGKAGDALVTFARSVETEQSAADGALVQARILRGDLAAKQAELGRAEDAADRATSAKSALDHPDPSGGASVPPPDPEKVRQATRNAQQAGAHQQQVAGQVAGLQAQLAELRTKAQTAGHQHDTAVTVLARDLHEASDAGIHNKKWYQKLGDALVKAWNDYLIPLAKLVVAIGGIALLFLGGPLVWIVMAAALLVLADTIIKFTQGKAGWGDVLFAALDCIPVAGKLAMLAKAGRLGGLKWALRIARAERRFAPVIKVWRTGSDLKGFDKFAFTFAKGLGKDTLKDAMNGGWKNVEKNFLRNVAGNAIGAGTGELLDKGFSKIPRMFYRGDLASMTPAARRSLGHLQMFMNGQTEASKIVLGTAKGFTTAVTKQLVTSTVFGGRFDPLSVGVGTASGASSAGVGYQPGLTAAGRYR